MLARSARGSISSAAGSTVTAFVFPLLRLLSIYQCTTLARKNARQVCRALAQITFNRFAIALQHRLKRARINAGEAARAAFFINRHQACFAFYDRARFTGFDTLRPLAMQTSREMQLAVFVSNCESRDRARPLGNRGVNVARLAVPQGARKFARLTRYTILRNKSSD